MSGTEKILHPFATEMRHLTSALNVIASDMIRLYELGLHPFLLVRFAGMMGILEYWQALGAPGRGGGWPRNT